MKTGDGERMAKGIYQTNRHFPRTRVAEENPHVYYICGSKSIPRFIFFLLVHVKKLHQTIRVFKPKKRGKQHRVVKTNLVLTL
jgi:hypothetical protein